MVELNTNLPFLVTTSITDNLGSGGFMVNALNNCIVDQGFKTQHCQIATVGPLNKAGNPLVTPAS